MPKKKYVVLVLGVIALVGGLFGYRYSQLSAAEKVVMQMKKTIHIPHKVDGLTTFYDLKASKDNTISYFYQVDLRSTDKELQFIKHRIIETMQIKECDNPQFQPLFDQNIRLAFFYISKDHQPFAEMTLDGKTCNP